MVNIRTIWTFTRYTASSLSSYAIDFAFFVLFHHMFSSILLSVMFARVISSIYNLVVNHHVVFQCNQKLMRKAVPYFLLSAAAVLASYGLITLFLTLCIYLYLSKIIADTIIYMINFCVQHFYIFKRTEDKKPC